MNEQEILDRAKRAAMSVDGPEHPYDALLRRHDRKRRNQRIAAGVVGIAVFVAAVWIVTSGLSLDRSETSVVPGGDVTGPAVTGPTETADPDENPELPPLVEPAPIGTVTQSRAGCALEIVAEPIPAGPGWLSVVNETNRWVAFELFRLDPEVLTFAQFEAFVAEAKSWGGPEAPPGALLLLRRGLRPVYSAPITGNFTSGDAFAVVCLVDEQSPGFGWAYVPFAVVGPIVVP